jgi:hypothetical protein
MKILDVKAMAVVPTENLTSIAPIRVPDVKAMAAAMRTENQTIAAPTRFRMQNGNCHANRETSQAGTNKNSEVAVVIPMENQTRAAPINNLNVEEVTETAPMKIPDLDVVVVMPTENEANPASTWAPNAEVAFAIPID